MSWRIDHLHESVSKPNLRISGNLLRGSSGSGLMSPGRDMAKRSTGWHREFDEPIALPDGRNLIVLLDAASYVAALHWKEVEAPSRKPRSSP